MSQIVDVDAEDNLEGDNLERAVDMFQKNNCHGVSCLNSCPIAGTCCRGEDSDGGGLDVSSDGIWPDKLVQYLEPLRQEVLARYEIEKALRAPAQIKTRDKRGDPKRSG